MKEQGIVKKVEGQLVWISAEQCVGCEHELHCGSCGPGDGISENSRRSNHHELTIFGTRRERLFAAQNPQSLSIKTGDRVEYFIAPGKAIKAGFLVLIVPILAFFLFRDEFRLEEQDPGVSGDHQGALSQAVAAIQPVARPGWPLPPQRFSKKTIPSVVISRKRAIFHVKEVWRWLSFTLRVSFSIPIECR
jgi:positive regulator of sigma E activity